MSKAVALALVFVASLAVGPLTGGALADSAEVEAVGEPTSAEFGGAQTSVGAVGTQTSAQTPTIEKSIRLHLTPSEAGRVDVSVTYDVPEELTSLRVQLPGDATDVTSDSFTETSNGYEWNGDTDPAELRFTVEANRSSTTVRSVGARGSTAESSDAQGTYSFVDTGSWALVTVPQLGTEWSWRNARDVTLTEDVAVDGEGSTGGEMAFLGPVETHTRTANGQTFRLTVPEGASMAETPGDVLDALAAASGQLRVGERDSNVWMVAAPSDVNWVARGIEYGGSDFWVDADAPLDDPGNVWFHEYVHTRQAYTATSSGQWTVEATADYYSALLALEQGRVDFESFSDYLGRGADAPWDDAVLARPGTWTRGANYIKGSLVWGELDRRVRLATDSSSTMRDVLWRLNQQDDAVSNQDALRIVSDVSSNQVADAAERFTETREAAAMWSRFEHQRAFSTEPAQMEYAVHDYRVTGPFRNESFDSPPTLYVGETLAVAANVTNTGGADGDYAATLTRGDDVLSAENGSLRPSESASVTLGHEFSDAGTYNLSVGRNSTALVVDEPPEPRVSSLSVTPSRAQSGEQVTVTATLSSSADAPAVGTVFVTLDGERIASLDATLSPGESVTRSVNASVTGAGDHTVAVGDRTARVTVNEDSVSGTSVPGFGVGLGVLALAIGVFVALGGGRER